MKIEGIKLGVLLTGLEPAIIGSVVTGVPIIWNQDFTKRRAIAKMVMTTVSSRTGNNKPTCEFVALKHLPEAEPIAAGRNRPHWKNRQSRRRAR